MKAEGNKERERKRIGGGDRNRERRRERREGEEKNQERDLQQRTCTILNFIRMKVLISSTTIPKFMEKIIITVQLCGGAGGGVLVHFSLGAS